MHQQIFRLVESLMGRRQLLVFGSVLFYAITFLSLYKTAGQALAALTAVPVAMAGWLWGFRPGFLVGLLAIPMNFLLFSVVEDHAAHIIISRWPGVLVGVAIGAATGWVRELMDRMEAQSRELARQREALEHELVERKRTEQALRSSEDRFRAFMDNSPAVAFLKDATGRLVYMNKTLQTAFSCTEQQWLGKTADELWPSDVAERLKRVEQEVLVRNQIHRDHRRSAGSAGTGSILVGV